MKIASSNLDMTSSHVSQQQYTRQESVLAWTGNRRTGLAASQNQSSPPPAVTTSLSDAGKAAQTSAATAIQDNLDAVENDPIHAIVATRQQILVPCTQSICHRQKILEPAPSVQLLSPDFLDS